MDKKKQNLNKANAWYFDSNTNGLGAMCNAMETTINILSFEVWRHIMSLSKRAESAKNRHKQIIFKTLFPIILVVQ